MGNRGKRKVLAAIFMVMALSLCLAAVSYATETIVYSQGFEASDGGFSVNTAYGTTGNWQWGTPSGVGPGGAHSGTKCWGTTLSGLANRPAEGSMVSPAIALPSISANQIIRVRFWAFVDIDSMSDRGEFFISQDGSSWTSLCQLYNNMETSPSTAPSWHEYEFTLPDSYAGSNLYLRFRYYAEESPDFYCGGSDTLSGIYIDDLAVTVYETSGDKTIFSLTAQEEPGGSCPWVAPWNGSKFQTDNDIYSVARFPENEYMDYYKLKVPLAADNGVYPIEVQELAQEDSYTDYVSLIQVDHAPDVAVAPDGENNLVAYKPGSLVAPLYAISDKGQDVTDLVSAVDNKAFDAYDGDSIVVNFDADVSGGAVLLLRVAGFIQGTGPDTPYTGPPAIVVETMDSSGQWQERNRLKPRFDYSECAFDLSPYLKPGNPLQVRLRSISHAGKYHAIDYVALYGGAQPAFTVSQTAPAAATSNGADIMSVVVPADGNYFHMSPGQKFDLEFPISPQAAGSARDFIFVSKGYYVPTSGSYLIYTWDGSQWVMRDGYGFPGSLSKKSFDLSLYLPDPDGEYKVRVWQDYEYEPASVDFAGMTIGATTLPLASAYDYKTSSDITSALATEGDSNVVSWEYDCPRNRVFQVNFTGPEIIPPTTNPVTASNSETPLISWTYYDANGYPQSQYEIQVWSGPGATGTIMWNPPAGTGTDTSATYAGSALASGVTYYARVRAFDGEVWGQWSETSFTTGAGKTFCSNLVGSPVAIETYNFSGTKGEKIQLDFDSSSWAALRGKVVSVTVSGAAKRKRWRVKSNRTMKMTLRKTGSYAIHIANLRKKCSAPLPYCLTMQSSGNAYTTLHRP